MKVLFIQPKKYFDELGITTDKNITPSYGVCFSTNLYKRIQKYDAIINCIEHDLSARKVINIANQVGVKTIFCMDGIFEYFNSINNVVYKNGRKNRLNECYDVILTPTYEHKKYLEKIGIKTFLYIPKRIDFCDYCSHVERGISEDKILITTANSPYFNEIEFNKLTTILINIVEVLESENKKYIFRIFDNRLVDILSKKSKIFINKKEGDISSIMNECSSIITTQSSIILTSISMNLPVYIIEHRSISNKNINLNSSITLNMDKREISYILNQKYFNCYRQSYYLKYKNFSKGYRISESTSNNLEKRKDSNYINSHQIYINLNYLIRLIYKNIMSKSLKRIIKDIYISKLCS